MDFLLHFFFLKLSFILGMGVREGVVGRAVVTLTIAFPICPAVSNLLRSKGLLFNVCFYGLRLYFFRRLISHLYVLLVIELTVKERRQGALLYYQIETTWSLR